MSSSLVSRPSAVRIDCLPFDIVVEIAIYLNLRDSFAFSKCFNQAHDAVYYIYSHRTVLNFESVLTADGVIGISDREILQLLHAHTRTVYLTNFALSPSFCKFPELHAYMTDYLCSAFQGTHPRGHLCMIQCPRLWGARDSTSEEVAERFHCMEDNFDDHGILTISGEFVGGPPKQMWSTTDLDAPWEDPYKWLR